MPHFPPLHLDFRRISFPKALPAPHPTILTSLPLQRFSPLTPSSSPTFSSSTYRCPSSSPLCPKPADAVSSPPCPNSPTQRPSSSTSDAAIVVLFHRRSSRHPPPPQPIDTRLPLPRALTRQRNPSSSSTSSRKVLLLHLR